MPEFRETFKFEVVGAVTTGVKDRWVAGYNGELTGLDAVVGTNPTGANLIFDITKNGTSVFTGVTLATLSGTSTAQASTGTITAVQTTIDVQPVQGKVIGVGTTILIDSEQLTVTATAGSPVGGPSGFGNAYRLTVVRGANGSTAATHNANAAVTYALPFIAAGTASLGTAFDNTNFGTFVENDLFALNVTQVGSTVAGSDLDVFVEFVAE